MSTHTTPDAMERAKIEARRQCASVVPVEFGGLGLDSVTRDMACDFGFEAGYNAARRVDADKCDYCEHAAEYWVGNLKTCVGHMPINDITAPLAERDFNLVLENEVLKQTVAGLESALAAREPAALSGWVEIKSEADLPKEGNGEAYVFRSRGLEGVCDVIYWFTNLQLRAKHIVDTYSRYIPIPPYTKPEGKSGRSEN